MQLLKQLYSINSKSGKEYEIKKFILDFLSELSLTIEEDKIGNLFITKGQSDSYPCVVAHLDEVHICLKRIVIENPPIIYAVNDKGEQVGIGADDKNGVWIAMQLLRQIDIIKVAFFVQEEKDGDIAGCRGSKACELSWFNDVKYVIECDRKGNSDFVIQAKEIPLCNYDFIPLEILKKYSYWQTEGGNTDVAALKRRGLKQNCCNLSCGYYNAHTNEEYTNFDELKNCLNLVKEIILTTNKTM
ncbi:MAG: hypothetical protein IIW76_00055 [Bacteroidales bacterium]|nr:hypothetical protein [Bacteroidales bacterium]